MRFELQVALRFLQEGRVQTALIMGYLAMKHGKTVKFDAAKEQLIL